jgi:hypothetical protein
MENDNLIAILNHIFGKWFDLILNHISDDFWIPSAKVPSVSLILLHKSTISPFLDSQGQRAERLFLPYSSNLLRLRVRDPTSLHCFKPGRRSDDRSIPRACATSEAAADANAQSTRNVKSVKMSPLAVGYDKTNRVAAMLHSIDIALAAAWPRFANLQILPAIRYLRKFVALPIWVNVRATVVNSCKTRCLWACMRRRQWCF